MIFLQTGQIISEASLFVGTQPLTNLLPDSHPLTWTKYSFWWNANVRRLRAYFGMPYPEPVNFVTLICGVCTSTVTDMPASGKFQVDQEAFQPKEWSLRGWTNRWSSQSVRHRRIRDQHYWLQSVMPTMRSSYQIRRVKSKDRIWSWWSHKQWQRAWC